MSFKKITPSRVDNPRVQTPILKEHSDIKESIMKNPSRLCGIIVLAILILLITPACSNNSISLSISFTVTFNSAGGSDVDNQTLAEGESAVKPVDPTKPYREAAGLFRGPAEYSFAGWYNGDTIWEFNTIVSGDLVLTAHWTAPVPVTLPAGNLVLEAINYVNDPDNSGVYTLLIAEGYIIEPQCLESEGLSLTLMGLGEEQIIEVSSSGPLFTVEDGVTLVLDNDITLQGMDGNDFPLLMVNGNLIMNEGAKVTGNILNLGFYECGSGVYVEDGTFTMTGGSICSNYGGGVCISGSEFTMTGGTIFRNEGVGLFADSYDEGDCLKKGIVTMSGGSISENTVIGTGAGVYLYGYDMGEGNYSTIFTMSGSAKITDNEAGYQGGGVVICGSKLIMSGNAEISGNSAVAEGGGVFINGSAHFSPTELIYRYDGYLEMTGGTIHNNTANKGAGVYVDGLGKFAMSGSAEISANIAAANGGGVFVYGENTLGYEHTNFLGIFTMSGGAIYGSNAVPSSLANIAAGGASLYIENGIAQYSGGYGSGNIIASGNYIDNTLPDQ